MVDGDTVVASNINRQLMATTATIGLPKVEVLRERLQLINPDAEIEAICRRYNAETAEDFRLEQYDYVIDAIDSLKDKALLINRVTRLSGVQLLSSMGAARKIDPTKIKVTEFWKVAGDPLARTLRQKFKQLGEYPERKFLCVYSDEDVRNQKSEIRNQKSDIRHQRSAVCGQPNGTMAHITVIFGNMLASLVLKDILSRSC
jgi:tRNA A37 threonylcarbamoyladenosine dehydratase